jgi:flagellar biosynthetic protein FlhB
VALKICLRVSGALLVLAALDFVYQKFDFERRIRMTKQEIKEEYKLYEGDPLIKSRIRRIQRELARTRMLQDVPKADVVITNPTHLAVAIQYDPETMAAPKVVAKGERLIAEKIKEIAARAVSRLWKISHWLAPFTKLSILACRYRQNYIALSPKFSLMCTS